ncbi:hypothetical protein AAE250_08205 [Bacteroides sp. GD17]|jgi:hypothetical protein|uniref:hypothetical protein n=1 Tax=Bacteroides sp. GD17 TaxID=3139826 RepID=UPI0025D6B0B8|nr:hypothetical protein [uncultured Bacteroides sp.]
MQGSYIQVLPARHGDALILHCSKGINKGVIVIDGGPYVNPRFNLFVSEVENHLPIDLMVMTHFDDDHLVGIKKFIEKHWNDNPFPVKRIWANCAKHVHFTLSENLSSNKASKMADVLYGISKRCPLDWEEYRLNGFVDSSIVFADIDILNPRDDLFGRFISEYKEGYGVEVKEENLSNSKDGIRDIDIDMHDLAKRVKAPGNPSEPSELINMVSLSMIIRCDAFSVLALGDSFPQEIYHSLVERGHSKENKLRVDFVKMPHHGSAENISNDLLDIIDCANYIITTDGGKGYNHPHREALANVICHPERDYGRMIHLYFNYPLDTIVANRGEELFNEHLDRNLNFECHEPQETDRFVILPKSDNA